MEYTIRRFGVGSVFKLSFVIYALLGLIMMFFYVLMLLMVARMGSVLDYSEWQPMVSAVQGFGALAAFLGGLFFALVYAVISAVVTSAVAGVYNLLAGWIGGLRLELEVEPGWGQGRPQGPPPGHSPPPPDPAR